MKLTIYTPVYNASKYIEQTIESIQRQTFTDWELLLYDDGSTDNSKDIIERYACNDPRLKYKYFEHTGNPAYLRNEAIKAGNGEWLANCDHDDIWHPNKLELQFNLINKFHFDSIVFTEFHMFKNPPNQVDIEGLYHYLDIIPINDAKDIPYQKINTNSLLNGNYIMNSSALVHRKVVDKIGLLNQEIDFRGMEDTEYWLRAACNEIEFYRINLVLSFWRVHEGNLSNEQPFQKDQAVVDVINKARKCKNMKVERKFDFYYMMTYLKLSITRKKFHQHKSVISLIKFGYFRSTFFIFVVIKKFTLILKRKI